MDTLTTSHDQKKKKEPIFFSIVTIWDSELHAWKLPEASPKIGRGRGFQFSHLSTFGQKNQEIVNFTSLLKLRHVRSTVSCSSTALATDCSRAVTPKVYIVAAIFSSTPPSETDKNVIVRRVPPCFTLYELRLVCSNNSDTLQKACEPPPRLLAPEVWTPLGKGVPLHYSMQLRLKVPCSCASWNKIT